jgi:hypothetical protein
MAVGVGAVAMLRYQCRGAHLVNQRDDLANRVIAMQRRAADIAVTGAGEQRDRGLYPARQPYGDTITRAHAVAGEVRCEPVRGKIRWASEAPPGARCTAPPSQTAPRIPVARPSDPPLPTRAMLL